MVVVVVVVLTVGAVVVVVLDEVVVVVLDEVVVVVLDEVVVVVLDEVVEGGAMHRARAESARQAEISCRRHARLTLPRQRFAAARFVPTHCNSAALAAQSATSLLQSLAHGFFAAVACVGTTSTGAIAKNSTLLRSILDRLERMRMGWPT